MKNIYRITLIILFSFSSCDFLEEEPRSEMSIEQFFSAPSHAENAVNSLYRNGAPQLYFGGGSYSGTRVMFAQYLSGFFDNEYRGQEPHIQHAQQLSLNGLNLDDYMNGIWADLYRAIARANNAIKYIPDTPGLSEANANRFMAEAKFFRAFAYYYLTRFFGEVPLVEEPYENLENMYLSKSPLSDIYGLIVEDLEFAFTQGGLNEAAMVNNNYRITKGTVGTVLAEVYLTMSGYPLQENRYADAARVAREVINSGVYSLTQHDLDGDGEVVPENSAYNKIRKEQALANEYIYQIEFFIGIAHNQYVAWSYPVVLASDVEYAITNGAYQPRPDFIRGYNTDEDLRIQEKQFFHTSYTTPDGQVKNFAPTPYIWHDDEALFETATSGKDLRAYGYSDLLLIAAEAIAQSEGVNAEAIGYLTQVRDRAYWKMTASQISAELTGLSDAAFVEEVWKERFRELVFDFKLWFDIVRTRKYPETSGNGEISYRDFVGATNSWGRTFAERHLLVPIPERERQRNPNLPQNPGYEAN